MDNVTVTKDLANKTLIIERVFDAPNEKLWRAYSEKELFEKWWGPEGWKTTVKEFNFTPGGRNHYGMKCLDERQTDWYGQTSWGLMRYDTISAPNSFSYKDYFADEDGNPTEGMPVLVNTVEFVEVDGKTKLVSRVVGETAEDIEKVVAMGMVEGYTSTTDRLQQLLTEL